MRISTPFCSKSGVKSASVSGAPRTATGVFLGLYPRNLSTPRLTANRSLRDSSCSHASLPENVKAVPETGSFTQLVIDLRARHPSSPLFLTSKKRQQCPDGYGRRVRHGAPRGLRCFCRRRGRGVLGGNGWFLLSQHQVARLLEQLSGKAAQHRPANCQPMPPSQKKIPKVKSPSAMPSALCARPRHPCTHVETAKPASRKARAT